VKKENPEMTLKHRIRHKLSHLDQGALRVMARHTFLFSFLCLLWLVLRSGRKPSRLRYPCQQFAAAQSSWLIAAVAAPAALPAPFAVKRGLGDSAWGEPKQRIRLLLAIVLAMFIFLAHGWLAANNMEQGPRSTKEMAAAAAALVISPHAASAGNASDVFVNQNIPQEQVPQGVANLLAVMGGGGTHFYRSPQARPDCGLDGIIGPADVVVIKVNAEWQDRGMTSTDVVKGLVEAIVSHPDGFTGEVVIADNGQWTTSFMDSPDRNNAYNHGQSFADVAAMYAGSHRVSVRDWTPVRNNSVVEFSLGDYGDGYVEESDHPINYPKFTTDYGTRISMRNGIWNGASYDNSALKLLNVPVLKTHNWAGVTASCKHFMGFWSTALLGYDPHGPMIYEGVMGQALAYGRFPDMNIIDATWSNASTSGPGTSYDAATYTGVLLASHDPVAVDYVAGKRVLLPVSGYERHDPDSTNGAIVSGGAPSNAFRQMLATTQGVLNAAGYQATMDENRINIFTEEPLALTSLDPKQGVNQGPVHLVLAGTGLRSDSVVQLERVGQPTLAASTVQAQGSHNLACDFELGTAAAGSWDVVVTNPGPSTVRLSGAFQIYQEASRLYFAEGYTGPGFQEYLCLGNPGTGTAHSTINYRFNDGSLGGQGVVLGPESRATVDVNSGAGAGREVSTVVRSDVALVVERPMYFNYAGVWSGGHDAQGVPSPQQDWYFAEGCTRVGFDEWICVLNPNNTPANLSFHFQTSGQGQVDRLGRSVPAHARATFKVNDLLGPDYETSLWLHADVPVVAERPMYFDYSGMAGVHWDGGHDVVGASSLSTAYYFAEGTTRAGFEEWLTLQNPQDAAIDISAEYQGSDRSVITHNYRVEAKSRRTVYVANEVGSGKDVSVKLASGPPFLAERPLYFQYSGYGASWTGGHCVIGATTAGADWWLAEGCTLAGFHEYLCLQNPGDSSATIRLRYFSQEQGELPSKQRVIPAHSRATVMVNLDAGSGFQLSTRVTVLSGPAIVVERPMYFDYQGWTGGHDIVGMRLI